MPRPIGAYVLQHRYRVDPNERDRLLALLAAIRDHALDLGIAHFEAWQDDEDPWQITEIHAYDSWSHFQRLSKKELPVWMEDVYRDLERLIEGGMAGIETTAWNSLALPSSP